jgi:thioredoxin-dependent peroxiredoxin
MRNVFLVSGVSLCIASLALLGCRDHKAAGTTTTAASAAAPSGELTVGQPAPEFHATAHDGTALSLAGLQGKNVVLYFYPKDETPGCTKEACAFRDAWKELSATGAVLVGISTDDAESHKKFAEHHQLPFHLVSDPDGAIAKAYGVPDRMGVLARQTVVIGPDGKVKKIYRSVDVTKHATEVLGDVNLRPAEGGRHPLAVRVDGAALPDEEARALWLRFSEWMEEHRGDLAGFAAKEGFKSVHPGVEDGRPVLLASHTIAQRAYAPVARSSGSGGSGARHDSMRSDRPRQRKARNRPG